MEKLGVTPLEIKINLDSTREAILSTASQLFNTTTESIGLNSGSFQIGPSVIQVNPTDSLDSLSAKINAFTATTGVSASILVYNSQKFLNLASVNNYFAPNSILYDYNGVLNGLFTPNPESIYSQGLIADQPLVSNPSINATGGAFKINGQSVTLGTTDLPTDLVTKINALSAGVTASVSNMPDGTQVITITSNAVEIGKEIVIEDIDSVIMNALIIPTPHSDAKKFKDYSKVATAQVFDGSGFIDRKLSYIPLNNMLLFIPWYGNSNQEFIVDGIALKYSGPYSAGINEKISINYALVDKIEYHFDDIRSAISSAQSRIFNDMEVLYKEYEHLQKEFDTFMKKVSIDLGEALKKKNELAANKKILAMLTKNYDNDRREDL